MEKPLYDPRSSYAIGVDVGGTKMNAGVVNIEGEVLCSLSMETFAGRVGTMDRMMELIDALSESWRLKSKEVRLRGIGVGSAGQIDWRNGSVRYASSLLPGYSGTPLKQRLMERYGLPVFVDNDVNVLALTEKVLGAGKQARHMLCLTLGTGVGGAIVTDGKIVRGVWGGAGEIGHLSVDHKGISCVCGNVGCLEQYASGTGIAARMKEKLALRGEDSPSMSAREVIVRWRNGDSTATEVMNDVFSALGSAISSLIHVFNPDTIVIGGGLTEAGEPLFEGIGEQVRARTMPSLLEGVRIVPAYQGNWGGAIGAALQAWEYESVN